MHARFAAVAGPILVLHDTTEFSFRREDDQAICIMRKVAKGPSDQRARLRMHTVCGILMYSSLAVTPGGLPLGLAGIKLWTRKKFKGTNALKGRGPDAGKHSVNSTRIPIEGKESVSWLENVRQSAACGGPRKLDRCLSFRISIVGRNSAWYGSRRFTGKRSRPRWP